MTFLRPAVRVDREELARFECARPERQFEIGVQEFVRDGIGWLAEPEGVDREVLVLGTVLDDLAQRYAGHVATWLVAPANFASHAMSEAVGADVTYPAETKPNALYAIAI